MALIYKILKYITLSCLIAMVSIHTFCNNLTLNLTEEEKQWITEHKELILAPDPHFPPFEYFDKFGNYLGVAADFIKVIEKSTGLKFKIVHLKNWDIILKKIKNKEIDVLGAAVPTTERLKFLKFTKSIVEVPAVIIMKKDKLVPANISKLNGMRIVVVNNYAIEEFVKANYKDIKLESVPDIVSGLRLVSFGRVDAMIVNMASASYYIQKEGITNLSVYQDSGYIYDLSIAIRNDMPILTSILNKAVKAIPDIQKQQLITPYFSLERKGINVSKNTIFTLILSFLAFVFGGFFLHIKHLRKKVKEQTTVLKNELEQRKKADEKNLTLVEQIHKSKKLEALGMLAGGVAHDLNNILSGVLTYPDLLLFKMEKDDPMRKQMKIIKNSATRAAAVVEDLLTISRGAAHEKNATNLKHIVRDFINSPEFKELCSRFPTVKISSSFAEELDNIFASKTHIAKAITNLVMNAVEEVGNKENGLVTISAENKFHNTYFTGFENCTPGNYVELIIKDNGAGISQENLEKIFQPFYSTKTMGKSGTGLGLVVVWNTIIDHNGMIKVNSDGKTYTEFVLAFPSTKTKELKTHKKYKTLESMYGGGETILIVDDELEQIHILKDILITLKYNVLTARSGKEAIATIKKKKADLVILDMLMPPGINGKQTYEEILKIKKNQKAIISTGFSESKEVKQTIKLGASLMISKPYTVERISDAVKEVLSLDQ